MHSWVILTGEYPPSFGGVADYTRKLAVALARAGDVVEVFAPSHVKGLVQDPGVAVHSLPDHYGPRSLLFLEREIAKRPNARLFVQYVPQAFGMRGMNLPFCVWLAARRRPVWVMFHEVAVWFDRAVPWKHNLLALVTQAMARIVATRADRIFISTTLWVDFLRRIAPRSREPEWLPIPSNLPEFVDPAEVQRVRDRFGLSAEDCVVATVGSQAFGGYASDLLEGALAPLLEGNPRRVALLLGKGSVEFAARMRKRVAERGKQARILATGPITLEDMAAHVAASTVVLQPCADGVSTRRTSVMAGLALGVPVITNSDRSTEPVWAQGNVVALAADSSSEALLAASERLLASEALRRETGEKGRALYRRMFSIESTVCALREARA